MVLRKLLYNRGLLFSFILILIHCSTNFAQQPSTGTLRGVVSDSTSGEALAYCNIYIEELEMGASTDSRGYFLVSSIPANRTYTLRISYVGYVTKEVKIFVARRRITHIPIMLSPTSIELQTVEKVGVKVAEANATDVSLSRISARDIEMLPKGVETDIFRALQYLPGVNTAGDISARYYVRGGASNQNLIMIDKIPIYNPFHAFGMFSVIDPEMINSLEFYKGGFTAEYSGRLSSVLNLVTKFGNRNKFQAKGSASFLTGKASIEGPIPGGSYILTGRKSLSGEVLKKFLNKDDAPIDFFDVSFKVNYQNDELWKDARFSLHGFVSSDNLLQHHPLKEDYKWENQVVGLKYFQISDDSPFFSEMSTSISHYKGELLPNLSGARSRESELTDFTMEWDFSYVLNNKDEINVGLKIMEIHTRLLLQNANDDISDLSAIGSNISIYLKYKLLRYQNFGLDIGTRVNATRLAGGGHDESFLEPRISATYRLSPELAFKGAWGIYQQDLLTLSDENEVIPLFEPWAITPLYIEPASAIHYVLGIDIDPSKELSMDIEGYYKTVDNYPILNDNKIFPSDPDLIAGQGESYGLEAMIRYNTGKVGISASYSLAWSFKEAEGYTYPPRYDSRHTLNLLFQYDLGNGWRTSAIWNFYTGLPFTQMAGFYDKLNVNDLFYSDYILNSYTPYLQLGDRNAQRLPDYHRLDLSVAKKFILWGTTVDLDISIINVYDRANIFYFKRETGERVNMLPFFPTATVKVEL